MKRVAIFGAVVTSFFVFAATAKALTIPNFPTCNAPEGIVKVHYPDGVHGIPGSTSEYRGSDTVYKITDDLIMQCYCAPDATGIQSNWWKVSHLSQEEKEYLVRSGWISIPNGALWGLDNAPYMVKNVDIVCGERGGAPVSNPQILGLAATGRNHTRILVGILGTGSLLAGLYILFVRRAQ